MLWCIFVFCMVRFVYGHYEITDEQYYQMPKLFDLDDYTECMSQRGGVYCLGSFELVPGVGGFNPVYERMKEYSKGSFNYNHTRLHRGFCMSKRCTHMSTHIEERFIHWVDNYTMEMYGFSSQIYELNYCKTRSPEKTIDEAEDWFYFVCKCIVFLNVFGTVYDIITSGKKANPYIMAWSVRSNWRLLTDDNVYGDLSQLQPLQFVRVLGSVFVMLGHVLLTIIRTYMHNPRYFELVSHRPITMLIHNGTTVVQMFTLITGFFLAYKVLNESDKNPGKQFNLKMLPGLVIKRVIRILPSYYIAVGFAATWWSRLSSGPVWPMLVEGESAACRDLWWLQISLVYNLVDIRQRCLPQTWSLAADLQLYVASAAIALLLSRRKYALQILFGLFMTSVLLVFGVSYIFSLKSMMMVANPEIMRSVYKDENSISFLYISPWASAPSCLLGMLLAHVVYGLQKKKRAQHKKEIAPKSEEQEFSMKFVIFRSLFFVILAWILTGNYVKDHASPLVTSVYTALERPVFALLVGGIIYGGLTKIDHFWLNLGSWRGWRVPGRLNLWVLLLHWIIAVSYIASRTQLTNFTIGNVVVDLAIVIFGSYTIAIPLTLMVEMPAQRFLQKLLFR